MANNFRIILQMEAKKPVNVFAAYQQMLNRSKLEAQNAVKTSFGRNDEASNKKEDKDSDKKAPMREGLGGKASDRFEHPKYDELTKKQVEELNPNLKYSKGTLKSPFYNEDAGEARVKSGIFSTDENAVAAALDHGVSTNQSVQSKFIPVGYVSVGLFDSKGIDIGMVDALVWQCYLGCIKNVMAILKSGYKPQKSYSGFNPITAAIAGRNLQVLKVVLKYAPIAELVNDEDGFGQRAIQAAAIVPGIDPFEFAREVVNAGGKDSDYPWTRNTKNHKMPALHLCLMRNGGGAAWSPNLFSVILGVSCPWYKDFNGENAVDIAQRLGNKDAVMMIKYFEKFGEEAQNNAITNNGIGF